jgi:uncharacterized protein YndB with AHSA1/START domain
MQVNVTEQISAVRRQLGKRTLPAGEARVITISQSYPTGLEDLWDACTNPERIPRWFLGVSGELREGGRFEIPEQGTSGTIERCDPPKGFAATWEFGGDVSWIEVRLTPENGGRTRLELEHVAHVNDDLWEQFGPGAVGIGWDSALLGLALHTSSGHARDPQEVAEWLASAEAKQFMTLSSEAWRDAAIAAGEDPAQAQAAADRSTAAYTAPPEESGQA